MNELLLISLARNYDDLFLLQNSNYYTSFPNNDAPDIVLDYEELGASIKGAVNESFDTR